MIKMGLKIEEFDDPVCNSFRPRVFENKFCYEVDVKEHFNGINLEEMKAGLVFILDYNEDRQMVSTEGAKKEFENSSSSFTSQGNTNFLYYSQVLLDKHISL